MNMVERAARVMAEEGFAGLARRVANRFMGAAARPNLGEAAKSACREYETLAGDFQKRTQALGQPGLENYYWYHTVDLGAGLVTPGVYDYRQHLSAFGLPDSMAGMRVLDVGSATGFFAFEFERRGAAVVSVELPSLADWDMLAIERDEIIATLIAWHKADSAEEAYARHVDGPFRFCQSMLGARATRCYASVYDLTLAKVGGEKFDFVFAGDLLLHLFSPLEALDVLAGLCRGSLVVTVDADFPGPAHRPLAAFLGDHAADRRAWWVLSPGCVQAMLKRVGFTDMPIVGRHAGFLRPSGAPYARAVVRASKSPRPYG